MPGHHQRILQDVHGKLQIFQAAAALLATILFGSPCTRKLQSTLAASTRKSAAPTCQDYRKAEETLYCSRAWSAHVAIQHLATSHIPSALNHHMACSTPNKYPVPSFRAVPKTHRAPTKGPPNNREPHSLGYRTKYAKQTMHVFMRFVKTLLFLYIYIYTIIYIMQSLVSWALPLPSTACPSSRHGTLS